MDIVRLVKGLEKALNKKKLKFFETYRIEDFIELSLDNMALLIELFVPRALLIELFVSDDAPDPVVLFKKFILSLKKSIYIMIKRLLYTSSGNLKYLYSILRNENNFFDIFCLRQVSFSISYQSIVETIATTKLRKNNELDVLITATLQKAGRADLLSEPVIKRLLDNLLRRSIDDPSIRISIDPSLKKKRGLYGEEMVVREEDLEFLKYGLSIIYEIISELLGEGQARKKTFFIVPLIWYLYLSKYLSKTRRQTPNERLYYAEYFSKGETITPFSIQRHDVIDCLCYRFSDQLLQYEDIIRDCFCLRLYGYKDNLTLLIKRMKVSVDNDSPEIRDSIMMARQLRKSKMVYSADRPDAPVVMMSPQMLPHMSLIRKQLKKEIFFRYLGIHTDFKGESKSGARKSIMDVAYKIPTTLEAAEPNINTFFNRQIGGNLMGGAESRDVKPGDEVRDEADNYITEEIKRLKNLHGAQWCVELNKVSNLILKKAKDSKKRYDGDMGLLKPLHVNIIVKDEKATLTVTDTNDLVDILNGKLILVSLISVELMGAHQVLMQYQGEPFDLTRQQMATLGQLAPERITDILKHIERYNKWIIVDPNGGLHNQFYYTEWYDKTKIGISFKISVVDTKSKTAATDKESIKKKRDLLEQIKAYIDKKSDETLTEKIMSYVRETMIGFVNTVTSYVSPSSSIWAPQSGPKLSTAQRMIIITHRDSTPPEPDDATYDKRIAALNLINYDPYKPQPLIRSPSLPGGGKNNNNMKGGATGSEIVGEIEINPEVYCLGINSGNIIGNGACCLMMCNLYQFWCHRHIFYPDKKEKKEFWIQNMLDHWSKYAFKNGWTHKTYDLNVNYGCGPFIRCKLEEGDLENIHTYVCLFSNYFKEGIDENGIEGLWESYKNFFKSNMEKNPTPKKTTATPEEEINISINARMLRDALNEINRERLTIPITEIIESYNFLRTTYSDDILKKVIKEAHVSWQHIEQIGEYIKSLEPRGGSRPQLRDLFE